MKFQIETKSMRGETIADISNQFFKWTTKKTSNWSVRKERLKCMRVIIQQKLAKGMNRFVHILLFVPPPPLAFFFEAWELGVLPVGIFTRSSKEQIYCDFRRFYCVPTNKRKYWGVLASIKAVFDVKGSVCSSTYSNYMQFRAYPRTASKFGKTARFGNTFKNFACRIRLAPSDSKRQWYNFKFLPKKKLLVTIRHKCWQRYSRFSLIRNNIFDQFWLDILPNIWKFHRILLF